MAKKSTSNAFDQVCDSVLYCLIRSKMPGSEKIRFLMVRKEKGWTFPVTKLRPGEDLYSALKRPMEEDLGLPKKSYFPEKELGALFMAECQQRYAGLSHQWNMFPIDISITKEAARGLPRVAGSKTSSENEELCWMTINEIIKRVDEQDICDIADCIKKHYDELLESTHDRPSMDALASYWAAENEGGVRALRSDDIESILKSGTRAFNLRVADPFLPYQKQGLGFTWSFFSPKDRQDIHVHGLPLVEIFGVFKGRLNLFYKHMTQRGANAWKLLTLEEGDWLEVEPLYCHFSYWVGKEGLGTVFKAAATGELGGVGELGMYGKTTCEKCPVKSQCAINPAMVKIENIYRQDFPERDYRKVRYISQQFAERQAREQE